MPFVRLLMITALALTSSTHTEHYQFAVEVDWSLSFKVLNLQLKKLRSGERKGLLQCHAVNRVTVAKLGLLIPNSVLPHPQNGPHCSPEFDLQTRPGGISIQ